MPAVSQAQFRFFQANRKKLGDKLADEYTKGVDYRSLPKTTKKADWGDYVAPVGGAIAGGLLGHLARSRDDKEEGNWTPALMGAGLGLGAGLLGNMALGGMRADQAQQQAHQRAQLIQGTAEAYGGHVDQHGTPMVAGRALTPEQLGELQGEQYATDKMGPPNPLKSPVLAPTQERRGGPSWYTVGRTPARVPGGHEGTARWSPSTPSGPGDYRTLQNNASQANGLGLNDVADDQDALSRKAFQVHLDDDAREAQGLRDRENQTMGLQGGRAVRPNPGR